MRKDIIFFAMIAGLFTLIGLYNIDLASAIDPNQILQANPCNYPPPDYAAHLYDYVGSNCNCSTLGRFPYKRFIQDARTDRSERTSEYYCFTTGSVICPPGNECMPGRVSGNGTIKMCVEDKFTTYSTEKPLSQTYNSKDGIHKINNECSSQTPYCEGIKCHQCMLDEDCDIHREILGLKDAKSKCKQGNYYGKISRCSYCEHLEGNGPKVINIIIVNGPGKAEDAQGMVTALKMIEPFGYLIDNDKFRFNFVYAEQKENIIPSEYEKEEIKINDTTSVYRAMLTKEYKTSIVNLITDVCGQGTSIIIDRGYSEVSIWRGYKIFGEDVIILNAPESVTIAHELAHQYASLSDEYHVVGRIKKDSVQFGPNIDIGPFNNMICSKFDNSKIDKENCFPIINPLFPPKSEKSIVFKRSTDISIMNAIGLSPKFNIISCMALLESAGEKSEEEARSMCKAWACEGKIERQSKQVC